MLVRSLTKREHGKLPECCRIVARPALLLVFSLYDFSFIFFSYYIHLFREPRHLSFSLSLSHSLRDQCVFCEQRARALCRLSKCFAGGWMCFSLPSPSLSVCFDGAPARSLLNYCYGLLSSADTKIKIRRAFVMRGTFRFVLYCIFALVMWIS